MVDFLANKFQDREAAKYLICEIDASYLVQERARAKLRVFPTVEGSSTFQVMVFTPGKLSFKAAICICLCNKCKCKYGSYEMFQEYEMISHTLNKVSLRSSTTDTSDDQSYEETNAEKFLLEGTICAITTDVNSIIKIIDDYTAEKETIDDYGRQLKGGKTCLRATFLEKEKETKQHHVYRVISKVAFVFKGSVVYPYVPYNEEGQKVIIKSEHYTDIIYCIEHTGLVSI